MLGASSHWNERSLCFPFSWQCLYSTLQQKQCMKTESATARRPDAANVAGNVGVSCFPRFVLFNFKVRQKGYSWYWRFLYRKGMHDSGGYIQATVALFRSSSALGKLSEMCCGARLCPSRQGNRQSQKRESTHKGSYGWKATSRSIMKRSPTADSVDRRCPLETSNRLPPEP